MATSTSKDINRPVFLCVDESVHSLRAFYWFYENFYQDHHVLCIVHVHSPAPSTSAHQKNRAHVDIDYELVVDEEVRKSTNVIQDYLNMCVQYGIKVKVYSEENEIDSIGRTICNLVKEHNPSCIIMGQRGLGAVKRTLYGSVSDYILHHAHIPLIIVPPSKESK